LNYLAHFHLAGDNSEHIAGALLGDYIKGPLKGELPPGIEQGIILHRRIDKFTDAALGSSKLHEAFNPNLRRYLGIVCDLYFDHLLASNWHLHDERPLTQYNSFVVDQLEKHAQHLPAEARQFTARLKEHEILSLYQQREMMARIFERTGSRLKRANPVAQSWNDMQQQHNVLLQFFESFYPQLLTFAGDTRESFQ
jgi:acyl carrier protein phosphodiesterase